MQLFNGVLLVNKPRNMTSFGVVAKVRGIIKASSGKKVKVGHCGTLDPLAEGLMLIVIGAHTKKAERLTKKDKTYVTTLHLGSVSTTADDEGEKTVVSDIIPSVEDVKSVLGSFVGEISQTPPSFSAIKIDGRRAYDLARKGKEFTMPSRTVTIHQISGIDYSYPALTFTVAVSSGTYIRSLAEDIGKKLQTGAYVTKLSRTSIDGFLLEDAITVDELSAETIAKNIFLLDDSSLI